MPYAAAETAACIEFTPTRPRGVKLLRSPSFSKRQSAVRPVEGER
jgi:hypothetical protein